MKDLAAKIDAATNAIAAKLQALIDKVNAGTTTFEEIVAVLQSEVDRLTASGEDHSNPIWLVFCTSRRKELLRALETAFLLSVVVQRADHNQVTSINAEFEC